MVEAYASSVAPARCSSARSRSAAKKRSATMPTKNGVIIAATAVLPYARPIWVPSNPRVVPRYVPRVTNQAPQMKYWRNIIPRSLDRMLTGGTMSPGL
jgi:hypothetical protein